MTNNTEILRTDGLKRSYLVNETKIDVLKGINLTINNQEFIAIMGKSGSGKTTLLKLLGLLDRPTEGKVFFKGEDSNSLRGDRLAIIRRREIGFIYQDYYLMDSLSVRENIMLPKILDHSPVEESITEAEKLADIMGVRALLDKKIFELSGGEKQRAAICRALMNHSDLILADEPTGNLDSASSETVMEYLQMINKDLKKAVVLVTHDAYVASFCDRVIFVKDGNIEVELRKKEKNTADNGCRLYRSIYTVGKTKNTEKNNNTKKDDKTKEIQIDQNETQKEQATDPGQEDQAQENQPIDQIQENQPTTVENNQ